MWRTPALLAGAVAAGLLLAGCGGVRKYSLAKTETCLEQANLHVAAVTARQDFVASTATSGAVRVALSKNEVTISFGRDAKEGERITQAYRRFHGRNIGIEDVLDPERNAVLLWALHPADRELSAVRGCLK